ncbi:hypothetical protein KPH14_008658 [Odynerus spinipes]|uniref:Uncharacterized protein n=1 Tax=Odynerus spinipes TaxID=1348599 RepID=A0AAD9VSG6_9HYME|nr:hypothetical protein KPH14_008658 [Odynerus spinipes]
MINEIRWTRYRLFFPLVTEKKKRLRVNHIEYSGEQRIETSRCLASLIKSDDTPNSSFAGRRTIGKVFSLDFNASKKKVAGIGLAGGSSCEIRPLEKSKLVAGSVLPRT